MNPTREQLKAGLDLLRLLAEAVREAQRIPSGVLYAAVISKVDIEAYGKAITMLKRAGLINETLLHELVWIGPATEPLVPREVAAVGGAK